MNDYDSETFLQDMLITLMDGFDEQTGELTEPLPVKQQLHYFLSILACLTQTLDCIDGRLINLNTELNHIENVLKGCGDE